MDDNKLNDISKKILENLKFEKPSDNFTETLMLKIEQAKSAEKAKLKPAFKNKFMLIFILTFSIITIFGYFYHGNDSSKSNVGGFKIPSLDISFLSKYFHINFDFGFVAKLIIGSIIILILFDLASGSLIDRIIDSKTRKENKV
jgi:hypothetical protein